MPAWKRLKMAPSTQNQAFHALLFLFEHVFKRHIGRIKAVRASKGKQIPTVMSESEVQRVFEQLHGVSLVIAQLLYGCGMRISEALRRPIDRTSLVVLCETVSSELQSPNQ